jgi:hypothetical protein
MYDFWEVARIRCDELDTVGIMVGCGTGQQRGDVGVPVG